MPRKLAIGRLFGRNSNKVLTESLHFRLGHINESKYKYMRNQEIYTSRGIPPTAQKSKSIARPNCDICNSAKGHREVSHRAVDKGMAEIGLLWHADLPAQSDTPALITGNKSRVLFTDDRKSRYKVYIPTKDNTRQRY